MSDVFVKVEASEWYRELTALETRVQRKYTNTILRKVANQIYLPPLRENVPAWDKQRKLRKSMGTITSKKRTLSTVFIGPRVPFKWNQMPIPVHKQLPYSGRLANIFEFNKGRIARKHMTNFRAIMHSMRYRAQAALYRELRSLILSKR